MRPTRIRDFEMKKIFVILGLYLMFGLIVASAQEKLSFNPEKGKKYFRLYDSGLVSHAIYVAYKPKRSQQSNVLYPLNDYLPPEHRKPKPHFQAKT